MILALLIGLFCSDSIATENLNLRRSFRGVTTQFAFDSGKRTITFHLRILINGWAVNCARTRAIVWGVALRREQLGVPPFSRVYLINLEKRKIINHYTETRGPFGAIFSRDQKMAILDDLVLDLATGREVAEIDRLDVQAETCPSFPGKQSK